MASAVSAYRRFLEIHSLMGEAFADNNITPLLVAADYAEEYALGEAYPMYATFATNARLAAEERGLVGLFRRAKSRSDMRPGKVVVHFGTLGLLISLPEYNHHNYRYFDAILTLAAIVKDNDGGLAVRPVGRLLARTKNVATRVHRLLDKTSREHTGPSAVGRMLWPSQPASDDGRMASMVFIGQVGKDPPHKVDVRGNAQSLIDLVKPISDYEGVLACEGQNAK